MPVLPLARDISRFRVGEVSYNGLRFPPATRSTAKFEPVYDNSGRSMKYLKCELKVSAYIFSGMLEEEAFSGTGSADAALKYNEPPSVEEKITSTTDTTMLTLRARLSEPGQPLKFTYQGAGRLEIQTTTPPGIRDVDNGPKPKVVTWRPLTNKMAYVEWEVTTCFSPCANVSTGVSPSNIAQFPFTVEFNLSDAGLTTRVISGEIEIAMSRTPRNPAVTARAGKTRDFDTLDLQKIVLKQFPMLKAFKRSQTFSISEDRKHLRFTITDTEINSAEAYGEGCVDEDVTLSVAGSLDSGGFRQWTTSLSGSITLAPGYPKDYAYAEIARIFHTIYLKYKNGKQGPNTNNTNRSQGEGGSGSGDPSTVILQSVKYTDELFGRTIGFDISWLLFVTPVDLFKATGLFKPLRSSLNEQDTAWNRWRTSLGNYFNNGGYRALWMNEDNDVIVSLCESPLAADIPVDNTPLPTQGPPTGSTDPGPRKGPVQDSESKSAKDGYAVFDAKFDIEIDNHTASHTPLAVTNVGSEQADPSKPYHTEMTLPGQGFTSANPVVSHKVANSTYTLVFTGYAVRLNHPVDVPNVESYGGRPLTKVGTDLILPRKLGEGVDIETGKSYAIHGLIWRKSYTLSMAPSSVKINTDAHELLYR